MAANPFKIIEIFETVEGTIADFIQSGPSTGIGGHIRDGYRKRCEQFSNAPLWARLLIGSGASPLKRICDPYLGSLGYDGPDIAPAFTGGQCENRVYTVVVEYQTVLTNGQTNPNISTAQANLTGPIVRAEGRGSPAFQTIVVIHDGVESVLRSGSCNQGCYRNIRIASVTPTDGQPDECGDPPPEMSPGTNPAPDPGPTPGPEPFSDPAAPTGPPILPIPPYLEPGNEPQPIEAPELEPPLGNPEALPGAEPSAQDEISQPAPSGENGSDIDFGPPPDGFVWVGAIFKATDAPDYGGIAGSGPANLVYPRVIGNISLRHGSQYGTAERIRSSSYSICRPSSSLLVTGCRVNTLPGISFSIFPLKLEQCPEDPCAE